MWWRIILAVILTLVRVVSFRVPGHWKASTTRLPAENHFDQSQNSPSRHDTCKVLISGVVGTEAKEIYMKNGHYVVNFAVSHVLVGLTVFLYLAFVFFV